MSEQDKKHTDSLRDDSLKAASDLSQVTPEKKEMGNKGFKIIIAAVVLLILLTMIFSGGHKKKQDKSKLTTTSKDQVESQLKRTDAKLQEKPATESLAIFSKFNNGPTMSREYLARQNAPTSMYSAKAPEGSNQQNNAIKEATLADNSGNAAFANSKLGATATAAYKIAHPDFTVASGEFIHAQLETAVNSDLPGMVRAVVTRPAYAYVGEKPLIPAGSRVIGQYSSAIMQGQNRVMIVWNRIILPNGIAVNVNSPGSDELGRAGQGADSVNRHFFQRFGEATLLSLIGAGIATQGVGAGDQFNSAAQYRAAISESFQQTAQTSLQNNLPIKPTIHIYQGADINVFVAHDLSFYQVLAENNG